MACAFKSLGQAFSAVSIGDTIKVEPGTYTISSDLTMNTQGVRIVGDPGTGQIGPGPNAPLLNVATSYGSRIMLDASNVIFEGFEVNKGGTYDPATGSVIGYGSQPAVRVGNGSTGVIVRHNTVRGAFRGIAVADCWRACASLALVEDNNVKWNVIGIWIASTDDSIIRNNDIFQNHNGIEFGTHFTPYSSGNLVTFNHVHENRDRGIVLTGDNNTVSFNLVENNARYSGKFSTVGGITIERNGSGNVVDHNSLLNNGYYGVEFQQNAVQSGLTISSNLISGNGGFFGSSQNAAGVLLSSNGVAGSLGVNLTGNDIFGNLGDGIYIEKDATGATASGNIITSTGTGGSGISVNHASTGTFTATNNDWGVYTSGEITSRITESGGGTVVFSPFATAPLSLSAGEGGTTTFPTTPTPTATATPQVSGGSGTNIDVAFASLHNGSTVDVNSGTSTVQLNGPAAYTVGGTLIIPVGWTFDINPGVTLNFLNSQPTGITVYGTLDAQGISGNRVVFQSGRGSPANGDWHGITFPSGGATSLTMSYVDVLHTEQGLDASALSAFTLNLDNVTIGAGNCISQCAAINVFNGSGTLSGTLNNVTINSVGSSANYYGIRATLSNLIFTGANTITVASTNTSAYVYGIQGNAHTGTISNLTINATTVACCTAYGIFGSSTMTAAIQDVTIDATSGTSSAYGIYASSAIISDVTNVNVTVQGNSTTYGIYARPAAITNSNVTSTSTNSTAYGISGNPGNLSGATISSTSTNGSAYGISGTVTGSITNGTSITAQGGSTTYGISGSTGPIDGSVSTVTISSTSTGSTAYGISGSPTSVTSATITTSTTSGTSYGISGSPGAISALTLSSTAGGTGTAYGISGAVNGNISGATSITATGPNSVYAHSGSQTGDLIGSTLTAVNSGTLGDAYAISGNTFGNIDASTLTATATDDAFGTGYVSGNIQNGSSITATAVDEAFAANGTVVGSITGASTIAAVSTGTGGNAVALRTGTTWIAISGSTLTASADGYARAIEWTSTGTITGTIGTSTLSATATTGNATNSTGAIIGTSTSLTISGDITGATITVSAPQNAYGIALNNGAAFVLNSTISGGTIKATGSSSTAGLYAQLGPSGAIGVSGSGNTISGTGFGVRLTSSSTSGSVTANIFDNSLVNNGTNVGAGISFENGANPTFTGNAINNNSAGVLLDSTTACNSTIGNTFINNTFNIVGPGCA